MKIRSRRSMARRRASPRGRVRYAVVGLGHIAQAAVLPAFRHARANSELAALVSGTPDKLRVLGRRYGVRRLCSYDDMDELFASGDIDAAYIALPNHMHREYTIRAARAGLHVLCEKPMAVSARDCAQMIRATERARVKLLIAYRLHFERTNLRASQIVRSGVLGDVRFFSSDFSMQVAKNNIRLKRAYGGGPLYDIASHRIDLLNHFFGEPQDVRACLSNAVHSIAVEDSATVLMKYANGIHAIVDVRWNSRISRDEFRIVGTEGEIDLSPLNGPSLLWPGGCEQLPSHQNLHFPCIKNFVDAVLNNEILLSSGASAHLTDWITEKAVANGRIIPEHHANLFIPNR